MGGNAPRPLRVLGFGTYDARLHPRIRVLLEGLAHRGLVVRELNEPLGLSTADKVKVLAQPWRLPMLAGRLLGRWGRLASGSFRYRGGNGPDAVVVGYMGHFDVVLARVLYPRTTIVLDHLIFAAGTARDRGESGKLKGALLGLLDRLALATADVIVTDTEEHRAAVPANLASKSVVTPVGAPEAWFEARHERDGVASAETPLRVVFFGLFTPLQGTTHVAEGIRRALERGVPLEVTLVGDGQDAGDVRQILGETERVTWLPWVDGAELPSLVAANDVCLGIFGTTSKARAVVPNKVYQGAAAGCAIVTSATEPQRRMLEDSAVLIPEGDPEALAKALADLQRDRQSLDAYRRAAGELADRAFSSEQVVGDLVSRLRDEPRR